MSFLTPSKDPKPTEEPAAEVAAGARLLPRITIQAFCEHSQTAELVEAAVHDRRMSKVALTTHNGGLEGAVESYRSNPTPNLIIVETSLQPDEIPVFWACGVTPQAALVQARLPLAITHAPGSMLVTDLLNHELAAF